MVLHGETFDDAYAHSRELESELGLTFVHPFDDPDVIAGQGTIGMEILKQRPEGIDAHLRYFTNSGGAMPTATLAALRAKVQLPLAALALIVLVAGIIPMFRHFERRWETLSDAEAANPALRDAFRRDQLATWAVAIGLPFLLAAVFRALVSLG